MDFNNPQTWLQLNRIVRFGETDAAGVIHFYQLLCWCHESWEESLQKYGLEALDVFPGLRNDGENPEVSLPIVHCQADFLAPIKIGDNLSIELEPEKINMSTFRVKTIFHCSKNIVARGLIQHLAIHSTTRSRCALPEKIDLWLEASCLRLGPRNC